MIGFGRQESYSRYFSILMERKRVFPLNSVAGEGETKKNAVIQLQFDLGFIFNLSFAAFFVLQGLIRGREEQCENKQRKGLPNKREILQKRMRDCQWRNTLKCNIFMKRNIAAAD